MIKIDPRKLAWTLLGLAILYGGYDWWIHRPLQQPPGILVAESPQQTVLQQAQPWTHKDYLIKPLAQYQLQARVLGRETYRFDATADLSPLDLALGWGPLSDSAVLEQIEFSQSSRWLSWRFEMPPVPPAEIARNVANVHVIPANPRIERLLDKVRPGQIAELSGYLVEVRRDGVGSPWASSLSRDDTGKGACEIMWVEHLRLL
ncbi:MAG: hypothetical protein KDK04_02150 [Candidatus Competibacteraceae bacterium]|nr:hypothetical protein [Candidatus Competibacteraceae bacterium]MCB1810514.1 hypothetical protein [Candidatus Competibacteraceae bacterium]